VSDARDSASNYEIIVTTPVNDETRIFLEALQERLIHDTVHPDCPLRREVIGVVGSPAIDRSRSTGRCLSGRAGLCFNFSAPARDRM
jgi:hypothetical protein